MEPCRYVKNLPVLMRNLVQVLNVLHELRKPTFSASLTLGLAIRACLIVPLMSSGSVIRFSPKVLY